MPAIASSAATMAAATMATAFDDVVGRNHAGLQRRRRAVLDDGVERDRVQATAGAQQREVEHDAPAVAVGQHAGPGGQALHVGRGMAEVPQEQRQAEAGEGHQPGRDLAVQQAGAAERPGADADGEHQQQQREHVRLGMEAGLDDRGQLGEQGGAHDPEPAQAQQAQPDGAVGAGQAEQGGGFAHQVPADVEAGRLGRRGQDGGGARDPGGRDQHPGGRPRGRRRAAG